jgi:hypothetical protein
MSQEFISSDPARPSGTVPGDRELLELAARAVWAERDEAGVYWLSGEPWNPLESDGDALRTANRTGICIEFGSCADDAPIVRCGPAEDRNNWPQVCNFPDPGKATRHAIVEAVAAQQRIYEAARLGADTEG